MSIPVLVGIAGPSCAGKSQLARALANRLPGTSILGMDRYYRDLGALCMTERAAQNFDHPDALEWPRLLRDVEAMAQGHDVMVPVYDYVHHEREATEERFSTRDVLIVEGLYALYTPELRALYDLRVFIGHTDEDCMTRRVQRDVESRGRTADSIRKQFHESVWPMYELYVQATRSHADLVLSGFASTETMVAEVVNALPRRTAQK